MNLEFNEENIRGKKSPAQKQREVQLNTEHIIKVINDGIIAKIVVYNCDEQRNVFTIKTKKLNRIDAIVADLKKDYKKSRVVRIK